GGRTAARRRALERRVVEEERNAVGRQLDVALESAEAVRGADAKRRKRVFGCELAGAAVRDPARVRPGRGHGAALIASGRASTRADVAASNQCRCSAAARRVTTAPIFGCASVASSRTVKSAPPSVP